MSIPSGYNLTKTPRMEPEQMALFQKLLSMMGGMGPEAMQNLGGMASGNSDAFNSMQQPAINQFNQQLIPQLASQFAGGGMLNSSAFRNAAAGAAGNLSSDLASQRSQMQMQAMQSLLGMQGDLLNQQPYEYGLQKRKNWWDYLQEGVGMGTDIAGAVAAFY